MEIELKYGKSTQSIEIDEKNLLGIIKPNRSTTSCNDPYHTISKALQNPIGTSPFSQIIKNANNILIVVDDHTRSTPSSSILPAMIDTIHTHHIPSENISILFATGTHRGVKPQEAKIILGPEIFETISWYNHDCEEDDAFIDLGRTSYDNHILLNKKYVNADRRILTGDISFHYYAGFGGGRKSILPGVAAYYTIRKNHSMLMDEKAVTGNLLGNPIHLDMMEVALKAPPHFLVNVALTTENAISHAWAGEMTAAWDQGVNFYRDAFCADIPRQADIVVASAGGFPKDIDFYQSYKAMESALRAIRPGGVLVLLAECREEVGNPIFLEWMKKYPTLMDAAEKIRTNFALGGHKAFLLLKALNYCHVVLVSALDQEEVTTTFQLDAADDLNDGLQKAYHYTHTDAKIWIMPDGYVTLPHLIS